MPTGDSPSEEPISRFKVHCVDALKPLDLPWDVTVSNEPGKRVARHLALRGFMRSTFTWTPEGVMISYGELEEGDPDAFLVPPTGEEHHARTWLFTCARV
jgi:hypothetical protein